MDARLLPPTRERQSFLSPAQVIALGLVAASLGWAAWLLRDQPIREEAELLAGSVLPSSELALMEAAFDRAQLTDYRTEGGRVYVPRSRQSAYMRALVDAEALPREFGGSLRRALANNSPWQSKAVQAELLRVATQDELSLVLCSMPGIERAAVLYDVEQQAGLTGGSVKTASVSIRTQPDAELDASRVQAIRVLVAASIAGLSPERVAVTDLRNGRVFAGPLEAGTDDVAGLALARKLAYERALATKLRQAIAYVKGAVVDVTAEFVAADAVPSPVVPAEGEPSQKPADANAPAELPAAPPQAAEPPRLARGNTLHSLHVSIAVPESYVRATHADRGLDAAAAAAAEAEELTRIHDLAMRSLPTTTAANGCRVVVASFPAPGHVGERGHTPQAARTPASDDPAAASHPMSLQEVLTQLVGGNLRFNPDAVPREMLVAVGSVIAGLLAAILWLAGSRRRQDHAPSGYGRGRQPEIDWSRVDASRADPTESPSLPPREFRSAA
jgi:type III secretory pathway lipoprotein EscJ